MEMLEPLSLERAREILISHSKHPRNQKNIEMSHQSTVRNPVCGDEVTLQLQFRAADESKTVISEVAAHAHACTICTASASLLSEAVKGLSVTQAQVVSKLFQEHLTDANLIHAKWPALLRDLQALEHLKINKTRLSCGLLPWIGIDKIFSSWQRSNSSTECIP